MRKYLSLFICLAVLFVGCGGMFGETIQPEPQYKPTDVNLTCESITNELKEVTKKRDETKKKVEIKQTFNGINTAVGFFTFFNWFVIDLSNDEEVALKSLDSRIEYLKEEGKKMNCEISEFKTIEEVEKEKGEECVDDSQCPYQKWDRARLNVPHICCPPTK